MLRLNDIGGMISSMPPVFSGRRNMENTTLAVQALTEANEELQEENKRLRNNNRVLRNANKAVRGKAEDLMKQIEATNAHLFEMVAESDFGEDVC